MQACGPTRKTMLAREVAALAFAATEAANASVEEHCSHHILLPRLHQHANESLCGLTGTFCGAFEQFCGAGTRAEMSKQRGCVIFQRLHEMWLQHRHRLECPAGFVWDLQNVKDLFAADGR